MNVKIANAFYFFLVIICCGMIIFLAYHHFFDRETAVQSGSNRRTPVVRAIEKAMPSVVNLRTKRFSAEGGDMTAAGCGIIIDQSGLILTNAHVVSGAGEIFATLSSGSVCRAYVVAENLKNDIALLKLEKYAGKLAASGVDAILPPLASEMKTGQIMATYRTAAAQQQIAELRQKTAAECRKIFSTIQEKNCG